MGWTPELIGGFTVGAMAVAGVLQRFGVLKLPITRNGNGNGNGGMRSAQLADCIRRHEHINHKQEQVERDLEIIKNVQAGYKIRLDNKKERLDKGEKRFSGIQTDVQTIKTDVAVIRERIGQQYSQMTETMQLILKKIEK